MTREEAIKNLKNVRNGFREFTGLNEDGEETFRMAIKALKQPEPHWIPCSERWPEDGKECLVSIPCSKKNTVVDMASYSTDLYKVDKYDFHDKQGVSGWYQLDREYGYLETLNVTAWMPLPEPYKGE